MSQPDRGGMLQGQLRLQVKSPAEYKSDSLPLESLTQRNLVIGLDHQGAQTESALCHAGTADLGQSDRFQAGRGCMSQQSQHLHSAHHAVSRWIIAAPAIVNRLARLGCMHAHAHYKGHTALQCRPSGLGATPSPQSDTATALCFDCSILTRQINQNKQQESRPDPVWYFPAVHHVQLSSATRPDPL